MLADKQMLAIILSPHDPLQWRKMDRDPWTGRE